MINFNQFLTTLSGELENAAKEFGGDLKDDLIKDGTAFAQKMKGDIEQWSEQLEKEELTKAGFEFLLKGKKDLAEMKALEQKGLAQARIDKLKASIVEAVTNSVFKVLP